MAASRGDHARILPGTLVNNRYEVGQEMGRGNFSVVYSAKDKMSPNGAIVALKFVKKEYAHDAKFEHDILKAIRDANPSGQEKVLMMIDHFAFNRHPCFVLAPKGCPLKARRLGVREGHVSRNELRALTKQMCEALAFLHFKMKLVHTDLKPENILLDQNLPSGVRGLGDGFTIVDFGSASFYRMDRLDSDLISTRPYRSPEVVLGNGWYYPADTWSLGCILYEVYTGHKLFDVSDDHIHLAQMTSRLGAMPKLFTHDSQNSRRFFDHSGQPLRGNLRAAPYIRAVSEELREDREFCDLIVAMLAFEPSRRIRCDEALRHPFITGESLRKAPSPVMDVPTTASANTGASSSRSASSHLRTAAAPLGALPTNAAHLRPMPTAAPSASSSAYAYDKENAARSAAAGMAAKPLYNNIRLGALSNAASAASSATNTPHTARGVGSSSSNPYGYGAGAPLSARPSLISPSTANAIGGGALHRVPSASSLAAGSGSAYDDRLGALKRVKSEPHLLPVAGRSSGVQYAHRLW